MCKQVTFPLDHDIDRKYPQLPNIIEPQIKAVSILKDNSMKIVYPLPFQLSSSQTLGGSRNDLSIFPSFIIGVSKIAFLK